MSFAFKSPETNLQNVPRDPRIKRMFIPRDGYFFVEADLSQAEARVVAWKAEERKLIDAYARGEDVHSLTAGIVFAYPVKKGMPERQTGKTIGHASNYTMGPRKLVDVVFRDNDLVISEKEARLRQNRYYQGFPNIKSVFHREIRVELQSKRRTLTNPFGRVRKFYQPWGDELFRMAYSHYAQSTVADVVNHGMIRCWDALPKVGVRIVAQIHDSLLFEVPKDYIGEGFKPLLREIVGLMTIPFQIKGRELIIPVEIKWGTDWGNMEEVKL